MMLRRIILGIITASFCFGVFIAPVFSTLRTGGEGVRLSLVPAIAEAESELVNGELECPISGEGIFCGLVKYTITITTFVSNLVLVLVGLIMDYALDFTMASGNYSGAINSFIETGWKIVRDLANILFIFGLVVAAFYLILQPGPDAKDWVGIKSDPKRIVVWVIIMALLVNFSLLFTKIIVDVGNITGRVFYTRISQNTATQTGAYETGNAFTNVIAKDLLGQTRDSVSLAILSKSNPQELILSTTAFIGSKKGWDLIIAYLFTSLMTFAFNIGLIFTFAVVALLFFARTFGLWLAMILSPLAFILYAVPLKLFDDFKFEKWIEQTSKLAFVAPAFLFFIYLAIKFLSLPINFPNAQGEVAGFFALLLAIAVKLIATMFIILKGKSIAENMSGEVGKLIGSAANTVAGLAVGGAVGGTAFMARQTLGRAGARVAQSEGLRDLRSGNAAGARDRLATKFGNWGFKGAEAKIRASNLFNTTAGTVVGRKLAAGVMGAGKKVDEQSFDARKAYIPWMKEKGNLGDVYASQGADLGTKNLREGGFTENKKQDIEAKRKKIIEEAEATASAEMGPYRQDVQDKENAREEAEKALENEDDPAVAGLKAAEGKVKDADDAVKNSDQGKKIEDLNNEMAETVESFTNYNKAIKEAEQDLKEVGAGLTKEEKDETRIPAEETKLATENATLAAYRAAGSGKTPAEIEAQEQKVDEQKRKVERMKNFQTNAALAQKNVDAAKSDKGYLELKKERDRIQKEILDQKTNTDYQELKKKAQEARQEVANYKKTDPGYKALLEAKKNAEKALKDAKKKLNDAEVSRLKSLQKVYEQWIDTTNPSDRTMPRSPLSTEARWVGRPYEFFVGSTPGTRAGATEIRKRAKDKSKPSTP